MQVILVSPILQLRHTVLYFCNIFKNVKYVELKTSAVKFILKIKFFLLENYIFNDIFTTLSDIFVKCKFCINFIWKHEY